MASHAHMPFKLLELFCRCTPGAKGYAIDCFPGTHFANDVLKQKQLTELSF